MKNQIGKTYVFKFKQKGVEHTVFTFQPSESFAWDWFKSTHKYARDVECKES